MWFAAVWLGSVRGSHVDWCTSAAEVPLLGSLDHDPTGCNEKYPAAAGGLLFPGAVVVVDDPGVVVDDPVVVVEARCRRGGRDRHRRCRRIDLGGLGFTASAFPALSVEKNLTVAVPDREKGPL